MYSRKLISLPLALTLVASAWWAASAFAGEDVPAPVAGPADLIEKTDTIAAALDRLHVDGWKPAAPVERYVVANLYDKIDGRSELFMAYGVAGLAFVTFKNPVGTGQYIDIYLYDMASAPGAFGVFSVERWQGQEPLKLGRDGYRNANDVFFWKGPYYASILGSGDEPNVREAQTVLANALANTLTDSKESLWGFDILPKDRVVPDSVQYFMVDALSLSFMTDTYTAEFKRDGGTVTAFVSRADSTDAAQERYSHYLEYMKKYGASVEALTDGDTPATIADMGGGYHDVVFRKARYVAGVTAIPNRDAAIQAANAWRDALDIDR